MFWEQFKTLCAKIGESPNTIAAKIGKSSGSVTNWKNGAIPQFPTLKKLSDYFGVSVDYLLGKEEKNAPGKDNLTEGEKEWLEFFREIPEESRSLALEVFKTFRKIPEDRQAEALELLQVALRMQKRS